MYLRACSRRILGETAEAPQAGQAAPKEQMPLNLSGKRARICEQSGERLYPHVSVMRM